MDKPWMPTSRESEDFKKELEEFLSMAFTCGNVDGKIICPCKKCRDGQRVTIEVAKDNQKSVGFAEDYTKSVDGSKMASSIASDCQSPKDSNVLALEGPDVEANTSGSLLNDDGIGKEVPPGAQKYPQKISDCLVGILRVKRSENLTSESITMLLDLLNRALPRGEEVPKTCEEMLQVLGEEDDTKTLKNKRNKKTASISRSGAGM
ncbi:hypothetical protein ACH5RR_018825 [Cinchona calisaya]|uniref:Transposase-associated domain-containing protein n=1 Tax=Cinchona calisaya TaxID=153742 RepID=A0ABD2ZP83_9GENT